MASRDKKSPTVGRKQATASPQPASLTNDDAVIEPVKASPRKKEQPPKRTITLKTKPKSKIAASKLLGKAKRNVPVRKTLLKNGVATANLIRKRPLSLRERIIPPKRINQESDSEERVKRKIKKEPIDPDDVQQQQPTKTTKSKRMKKVKEDLIATTIEEIVIKTEPEDDPMPLLAVSEPIAVPVALAEETKEKRPPRNAAKKKLAEKTTSEMDIVKKRLKLQVCEQLPTRTSIVIDSLDLNVNKIVKDTALTRRRRHSIEKFPITIQDVKVHDNSAFMRLLPKGLKAKRPIRPRPSSESRARRSDSPMRMLRNGKTRRLQQFPLFDGLDSEYKMRRRLASDFSGSEMSKMSGYESDSSCEVLETDKEKELQLKKDILETLENNPPETAEEKQIAENFSAAIKRSLSMDATTSATTPEEDVKKTDTNSNLCPKSEPSTPVKTDFVSDVPKLLGIMKQAFNEKGVTITEEQAPSQRRKTRSSAKKTQTPEKDALTAVGIAIGPEITVTAEQVPGVKEEDAQEPDTVEEAEAELIDILNRSKKSPESTPASSVNGDGDLETGEHKSETTPDATPESLAEKSQILKALGLQTLQEAEEQRKRQVPKGESYTGTLKTVIKLNRCAEKDKKKSSRNHPIKMTLQKKGKSKDDEDKVEEDEYKIMKEGTSGSWKQHHGGQSSDTAGAQRKSHYSNRSNMDGSSEHTSDGDTNNHEEGAASGGSGKLLVIPEKASSFSIHPGRLCKDECSYCFGKFGLFDTPCHIAQMKSVERQDKILSNEKHLTRDSCLCDACYRHVDRKAHQPTLAHKSAKRNALIAPAPRENHCHVLGCNHMASNILKRKWLIKMRKAVCQVINIDLDNPGLHSIPTCKEHYAAVEHLLVCTMCKRRLARNHIHYLGSESNELQIALNQMHIPVKLNDKPVVCKLCKYFANLVLKMDKDSQDFFLEYKRRLLHYNNVEPMDVSNLSDPVPAPAPPKPDNTKKRKRDRRPNNDPPVLQPEVDIVGLSDGRDTGDAVPSSESRPDSPCDYMVDYRNLIPNIAIECVNEDINSHKQNQSLSIRRISKAEAQEKKRMRSDIAVQRLGSNPSISIRQMFPGEEDIPLNGNIDFHNVKERTPEGWEKCTTTIQYDPDMRMLWQELQKPYGNQSSFLRHLVLLEKYFRNGDLVLSPRASNMSLSYTESVQNRLRAYDNISSQAGPVQPLSMLPFNNPKMSFNTTTQLEKLADKSMEKMDKSHASMMPVAMSTPNPNMIVNQAQLPKNVPLTIKQANSIASVNTLPAPVAAITPQLPLPLMPPLVSNIPITTTPSLSVLPPAAPPPKSKPPGLISLQASKLQAPPASKPQSQKIKFPITKNWRPKLIPIDPAAKPEKKPGLVQVISGGKPYHITLEDYKKMCAIKRTYDLRQKRLQESLKTATMTPNTNPNSLLRAKAKPKSPSTSDQEEMCETKVECKECLPLPPVSMSMTPAPSVSVEKMPLNMPKIPKSLTVIPQTVSITKVNSRPSSPKGKS